jgi:hypothetical protein
MNNICHRSFLLTRSQHNDDEHCNYSPSFSRVYKATKEEDNAIVIFFVKIKNK